MNSSVRAKGKLTLRQCFLMDVLILPGLGTWLRGQRLGGAFLMLVALTGVVLFSIYLVMIMWVFLSQEVFTFTPPYASWGAVGAGMMIGAWGWVLAEGLIRGSFRSSDLEK